MSQERRKSNVFENATKGFHRRMSGSFGRPSRTSNSPYEHFTPVVDDSNILSAPLTSLSSSLTSTSQRRNDERDTRLISPDKLMDGVAVKDNDRQCFENINIAVRALMNGADYDVADDKYVSSASNEELTDVERQERQREAVKAFMKMAASHCPPHIWGPVSHIASLVLLTRELRNPEFIKQQCAAYPALQIVQDADRLDGLGAVGIFRGVVYRGAREPRGTGTVRRVVQVVDERHSQYVNLMKTWAGRKEAAKRWDVMVQIRDQIMEQADCNGVLGVH